MANKQNKIVCLIGKSSSGKDTINNLLLQKTNLKQVVSYTTRPPRVNEQNGKDYNFVDEDHMIDAEIKEKLIERRDYDTAHGRWTYATIDDGQFDCDDDMLIVAAPKQFYQLRRYFGEDRVVPVYIYVDDTTRLKRAIAREEMQETPKYTEMCRRFLADEVDFKHFEENSSLTIKNYDAELCVNEIISALNLN